MQTLRLQWRDRSGFAPDSLFSPKGTCRRCLIVHPYCNQKNRCLAIPSAYILVFQAQRHRRLDFYGHPPLKMILFYSKLNHIFFQGTPGGGLIGNRVQIPNGPATVCGEQISETPLESSGKVEIGHDPQVRRPALENPLFLPKRGRRLRGLIHSAPFYPSP